jgi:uncharacterized lipoprotein YddW (UPF0748 family)
VDVGRPVAYAVTMAKRAAWLVSALLVWASGCVAGGDTGAPPAAQRGARLAEARTLVTDWSGGVAAANHPAGAGQYAVWYDAADNTFGTPSAATLDGAPAMRIDDGGFANGAYAIYAGAIPTTGTYRLEAKVQVVETGATATGGIDTYRLGAAVGALAAHRGPNPSALAGLTVAGSYAGLTDSDDTAAGPQTVATAEFAASAGDDLLVAFGTDVASGTWAQGSQTWGGAHVLVGPIELVAVEAAPSNIVDNDGGPPAYVEAGPWATGGVPGHGGSYRFAGAGNASSATFTKALDAGFYEVETIYRAGTNRASQARYAISIGGAPPIEASVDQRFQDQTWVPLGLIELGAPANVTVTLDAAQSAPAGQVVIADAVRFVPSAGPPPVDPPELRLASITVFDPIADIGAIQSTVTRLARLRYNAVAVHTRYRGDATYFPNKADATYPNTEPRSPQAGAVDALGEFVTRGHAAGLKVFAYVNTHLVTDGDDEVADPTHVANTHPEWRTYAYNGGSPVVQTVAHDPEGLWLDAALPAARAYLADVVGDIASNYAIDGVVLDRIRYPQTAFTRPNRDFGYHPDAVADFNALYKKTGVPDPYDPNWIAFRQRAVSRSVRAVRDRLADVNPELLLLAFPLGRFSDATSFAYQDWPGWLDDRIIDGVLPQIYTADLAQLSTRLAEHRAAYAGDRLLGVTLNAFSPGIDLAAQIELARAAGFDGSSPFRHGTMDALGYIDDLDVAWPGVAPFPATPWKGAPVLDLDLRPICGAPAGLRRWRVRNDNAWSIEAAWWVVGTPQHGSYYAAPGETTFDTTALPGLNLALLSWRDHEDRLRTDAALAFGSFCW